MAQRTVIVTTDDVSGEEIAESEARNVEFEFDGSRYVIDLGPENAEKFSEAMAFWVGHATPMTRRNASVTSIRNRPRRVTKTEVETDSTAIRAWAESQGIVVSGRGRVPRRVREAYADAHRSQAAAI